MLDQLQSVILTYVPQLLAALAILVVGWLLARLAAAIVRRVLRRLQLDSRIDRFLGEGETAFSVEGALATVVFALVMIFVVVAAAQALRLTVITNPLNRLLGDVLAYLPKLVGGLALLGLAWLLATAVRYVLKRLLGSTTLDERFNRYVADEGEQPVALAQTLGDVAYWLVLLLFLPGVLAALEISGLQPVQTMVNELLGFLPNLVAAGVILAVGWFVARIVQRIVTGFLAAVGADQLSRRVGLTPVLGEQTLSGLLGLVIYVLILIPVLLAALNALQLGAVTQPVSNMLNSLLGALPGIFGAVLILAIAYVVGRVVSNLVTNVLAGMGFDNILSRLGLRLRLEDGGRAPSALVGTLVLLGFMLFAVIEAANVLQFGLVADLVAQFTVFVGRVLLSLIILALGLYLSTLAAGAIRSSGAAQSRLLAVAARIAILLLAGAMALQQVGIANDIINLAFGMLLGAVAVAVALAFGLGGRDLAGRQLATWMASIEDGEDGGS